MTLYRDIPALVATGKLTAEDQRAADTFAAYLRESAAANRDGRSAQEAHARRWAAYERGEASGPTDVGTGLSA